MPPRFHVDAALAAGVSLALPAEATRHAQVLRLQPGDALTLFDGRGGEWAARVDAMGRRETVVVVGEHRAIERELPLAITLALAMPTGDRMDVLVEKAAELGVAAVQPLVAERSVLRLAGERADKRRQHWQAIAVAACEQCGRNRVPVVHAPRPLDAWLGALDAATAGLRWLLAWRDAEPFARARATLPKAGELLTLSGPEGGLTASEEDVARARGFQPVSLGERTLRADTAPLAVLAALALDGAASASAAPAA